MLFLYSQKELFETGILKKFCKTFNYTLMVHKFCSMNAGFFNNETNRFSIFLVLRQQLQPNFSISCVNYDICMFTTEVSKELFTYNRRYEFNECIPMWKQ